MKSKMNIKSIIAVFILTIMISMFFINMSFAANTAKVKVETANLRKTASEESTILEQISLNDEVEVIEKEGEWYKVKYNSIEGYLREDLIELQGEIAKNETQANNVENNVEQEQKPEEQPVEKEEITEEQPAEKEETTEETPAEKEETTEESGKRKVTENTKLKIVPVINASDIIEVKKDEEVNVIEEVNGWACIETQNTKGWIRQEKLQKEETEQPSTANTTETTAPVEETVIKTQYVASNTVNVRSTPSTNSEVVTQASINQAVEIYSETNGWSKVKVNGKQGYILSSLLSDRRQETSRGSSEIRKANTTTTTNAQKTDTTTTNTVKTEQKSTANTTNAKTTTQNTANNATAQTSSSKGAEIVAYAKQFIGTKYKYGGTSPSTGFDCSGFTQYVYKHFGISLPRTTGGQASSGRAISKSELQPGDLVIYSGHVAIYVGGGQVIHAPRTGKTVCIVSLNNAKPGCYQGARRVI